MKLLAFPLLFFGFSDIFMTDAYRILAIIPLNSLSHFKMCEQIMKNLAKRGHHVDVVSHYPQKKPFPNYHDFISLAGTMPDFVNNMTMEYVAEEMTGSMVKFFTGRIGAQLCQHLEHPKMQELIKNPPQDKPYDFMITEILGSVCYVALGHHLNVPVIGFSTTSPYPWMNAPIGNPENPAYIPNTIKGFSVSMNFWERFQNTISTISDKFWFDYYTSIQNAIVKKHFGPDAPEVWELERRVALLLVNSHFSLNGVRPLTPAVVEVGGIHVYDDGSELSPELKKWLDESTDGFVYFSFGSMLKIESFPKEKLIAIYASLAKIAPVRVLMKIAKKDELPPGLPENVLTLPWISQYKVLKHKKIRVFVTHGGLMSTQEAIVCGVPMIGIPLFADQILNINIYVKKNIAVSLNYKDISEESLDAALNAVLKNPTYRERASKLSAEFLDRPMSAADTATFWIEYVIRNGPSALRSPILDLTWWQVALLDVYGLILSILLLVAYVIKILLKRIIAMVSGNNKGKVLPGKKKR